MMWLVSFEVVGGLRIVTVMAEDLDGAIAEAMRMALLDRLKRNL